MPGNDALADDRVVTVWFLRHGPTAWNEAGRIQGRVDEPISPAGRAAVLGWQLPAGIAGAVWRTSPLRRARETAALLGQPAPVIEPRLIEMCWGSFEGSTIAELRQLHGTAFTDLEEQGLDFHPPGGESPRDVVERIRDLLRELAACGEDTVLVTHKGVLRAAVVLATGWPMLGRPLLRPGHASILRIELSATGGARHPQLFALAHAPECSKLRCPAS